MSITIFIHSVNVSVLELLGHDNENNADPTFLPQFSQILLTVWSMLA